MRTVTATRYVTPLREGGSLPGLVEADDDGLYVCKFRGAGQGVKALVAELIAGELARSLELPVPELVLVALDPDLGRAEPDREVQELIEASGGLNVGMDFLPGALPFIPGSEETASLRASQLRFKSAETAPLFGQVAAELAAAIVWFDALVTNVDRTPRNPNLLRWHGRLWLIDHGAALYRQHDGLDPADADRPFPLIAEHVLLRGAAPLPSVDERMAALLDAGAVERAVATVPDGWLAEDDRDVYAQWLLRRLEVPRGFVAEAEEARVRAA